MKARPILFSAPMVRALLAQKKTQTRRRVKATHDDGTILSLNPHRMPIERSGGGRGFNAVRLEVVSCPYGEPGDRLWVRETWRPDDFAPEDTSRTIYAADHSPAALAEVRGAIRWRPSIHMPRSRSRLTLGIEAVRCERLHDISQEDAKAEAACYAMAGCDGSTLAGVTLATMKGLTHAQAEFSVLWRQINGLIGPKSWDANPWVWVVSFAVAEVRP